MRCPTLSGEARRKGLLRSGQSGLRNSCSKLLAGIAGTVGKWVSAEWALWDPAVPRCSALAVHRGRDVAASLQVSNAGLLHQAAHLFESAF